MQVLTAQAQEAFLRVNQRFTERPRAVAVPDAVAGDVAIGSDQPAQRPSAGSPPRWVAAQTDPPRSLTYEQCCAFAVGKVADVLGPRFAEIDTFPTRVRLPDGPLQLVDRITLIEGEPLSMTRGRVVTEHTVRADRWYLEAGRIPTAIAVEAGQADLFLSGFLGIDLQTRGLAVYRLLDAVVSFHRGLPRVGETIVYDIHIDEFVQQGDAWLFRFRFDGTVNGEPFITMRNGVAGFFTAEALAAGKGIVQTALDKKPMPGQAARRLARPRAATSGARSTPSRSMRFARGDLATAFGAAVRRAAASRSPRRCPAECCGSSIACRSSTRPAAGSASASSVPSSTSTRTTGSSTCHFVDDKVMPGTLMYECCLHTLRVFLMRMGWVGEAARSCASRCRA